MIRAMDIRDYIHGRFERLRKQRSVLEMSDILDISRSTLQKFLEGDRMVSMGSLEAIEAWCDQEEQRQREA